jgi:hypothetical protein
VDYDLPFYTNCQARRQERGLQATCKSYEHIRMPPRTWQMVDEPRVDHDLQLYAIYQLPGAPAGERFASNLHKPWTYPNADILVFGYQLTVEVCKLQHFENQFRTRSNINLQGRAVLRPPISISAVKLAIKVGEVCNGNDCALEDAPGKLLAMFWWGSPVEWVDAPGVIVGYIWGSEVKSPKAASIILWTISFRVISSFNSK